MTRYAHDPRKLSRAISRFFEVRGLVRTKLAHGKKLDPSAWLRVETVKFIADKGNPRAKDVADYLSITAPSATSLLSGLARSGIIERRPDPADRRVQRVALTRKGKSLLEKKLARGAAILGELFAPLSDAELEAFTRTLERILEAGE
jgi:DNA-binding MarR family transcriptional regulator